MDVRELDVGVVSYIRQQCSQFGANQESVTCRLFIGPFSPGPPVHDYNIKVTLKVEDYYILKLHLHDRYHVPCFQRFVILNEKPYHSTKYTSACIRYCLNQHEQCITEFFLFLNLPFSRARSLPESPMATFHCL